jgi:hypothetical protein
VRQSAGAFQADHPCPDATQGEGKAIQVFSFVSSIVLSLLRFHRISLLLIANLLEHREVVLEEALAVHA